MGVLAPQRLMEGPGGTAPVGRPKLHSVGVSFLPFPVQVRSTSQRGGCHLIGHHPLEICGEAFPDPKQSLESDQTSGRRGNLAAVVM